MMDMLGTLLLSDTTTAVAGVHAVRANIFVAQNVKMYVPFFSNEFGITNSDAVDLVMLFKYSSAELVGFPVLLVTVHSSSCHGEPPRPEVEVVSNDISPHLFIGLGDKKEGEGRIGLVGGAISTDVGETYTYFSHSEIGTELLQNALTVFSFKLNVSPDCAKTVFDVTETLIVVEFCQTQVFSDAPGKLSSLLHEKKSVTEVSMFFARSVLADMTT
jgi:hypothetical protein